MKWEGRTLSGHSKVVRDDRYELTVHVPTGFTAKQVQIGGKPAEMKQEGDVMRVAFVPESTGEVDWAVTFN